jgi:hypothetical protein
MYAFFPQKAVYPEKKIIVIGSSKYYGGTRMAKSFYRLKKKPAIVYMFNDLPQYNYIKFFFVMP